MEADIKIVRCFICGNMGKQEEMFILFKEAYPVKLVGYQMSPEGPKLKEEQNFLCKTHYFKFI